MSVSTILARITAVLAAFLLQGAGVAVSRCGTVITYNGRGCVVAGECSGIRSVMTIVGLVLADGILSRAGVAHTALLASGGVVAAVACNVLRVCATVLWPGAHDIAGYIAFAGVLGAVFGLEFLLARRRK